MALKPIWTFLNGVLGALPEELSSHWIVGRFPRLFGLTRGTGSTTKKGSLYDAVFELDPDKRKEALEWIHGLYLGEKARLEETYSTKHLGEILKAPADERTKHIPPPATEKAWEWIDEQAKKYAGRLDPDVQKKINQRLRPARLRKIARRRLGKSRKRTVLAWYITGGIVLGWFLITLIKHLFFQTS